MATDFTNNGKTILSSGGFQPSVKNTPLDSRTRVNLKADIDSIPNPFVGMHIIVLQDEDHNNEMTEYVVKSLKSNSLGVTDAKINEIILVKDFLGVSLSGNGNVDSSIITIPGYTPSVEPYEFPTVENTWMTESDNKSLNITSEEFLSEWYDIYVGLHEDGMMVSKNLIGLDQSGTYQVYEYDFKPKKYNRTILLTSGLHTYELSSSFGLAHMVKAMMTTPYLHEGFKYIRENVRVKIIPILNPWGYNQSPKTYGNVNGVNPNRNFNYANSWEYYPLQPGNEWNYKGTEPFSEQETKNIANWLYYNKEIADFWIDCHTGYNDRDNDIWVLYQSYSPLASKIKSAIEKNKNRIKSYYSVSSVTTKIQIDYVNSIKIEWSELAVGIPMMVLEQSPLRATFKTGDYNNNGGAIREYATQLYLFIQELLSCDAVNYNLLDYLFTLRDDIFNNSCKQIPNYSSKTYNNFYNASDLTYTRETGNTYTLRFNYGSCSHQDGTISESTTRGFTEFIKVKNTIPVNGNTALICKVLENTAELGLVLRCFDGNKQFLGAAGSTFERTGTFGLIDNTEYIILSLKLDTIANVESLTGHLVIDNDTYNIVFDSTLTLDPNHKPSKQYYNVTYNLTGVTSSNTTATVEENSSYTTTLSENSGYTLGSVVVTMGEIDVTNTVYSNKVITIPSVTGNIVITATATNETTGGGSEDGTVLKCTNVSVNSKDGLETSNNKRISTDYIPLTLSSTGDKINVVYSGSYSYTLRIYDSSKNYLGIWDSSWHTATTSIRYEGETTSNIVRPENITNVSYCRLLFQKNNTIISTIDGTLSINNGTVYTLSM